MTELINYLNSPHLVAEFQKIFGIESHFNSNLNNHSEESSIVENNSFKAYNTNRILSVKDNFNINNNNELDANLDSVRQRLTQSKKSKNNLAQKEANVETIGASVSDTIRNNSSNHFKHKRQPSGVKMLINTTDHSHIVAKTTIHSRFWYYFFHLGASMGNLISFLEFI